jgi:hypothetical protein
MIKALIPAIAFSCFYFCSDGQKTIQYNLAELLNNNKLITDTSNHAHLLNDNIYKQAVSIQKVVWLKEVSFKEDKIDIDLRGKDVFLQSFLGIAFHSADTNHYEVVYFRPFNFRHADTLRRKWSVQYMVVPDFFYDKLRKEHPLVYENEVTPPVPGADEWFHATIVIKGDWITVFVNHSATASLKVKKLNKVYDGRIGLWDDELSGDFSNLAITD